MLGTKGRESSICQQKPCISGSPWPILFTKGHFLTDSAMSGTPLIPQCLALRRDVLLKTYGQGPCGAWTMCLSVWHLDRASDKTLMLGQPPTSLETDFARDGGVAASARSSEPCLHQIGHLMHFPGVEEGHPEP